jgi:polyphosphate kinase
VVYGLPGFKTHCKACLVVRQESDGIRRYCHVATGNYNVRTAGVYSDLGLFTSRESFGEDLSQLFNLLTGYTRPDGFHHLLLAPGGLRDGLVERIRREADHARAGRPGRIIAKMNGLVDRRLIEELYAASTAGVKIDLIVRGICCLRPEVEGLSENIHVVSIVDRYLEHARIFHFENGGDPEYLLASADWMPRNLDRRVEIAFPVLDPRLQAQIREILEVQLDDTVKARRILASGRSVRTRAGGEPALRSQDWLYEALAHRSGPLAATT